MKFVEIEKLTDAQIKERIAENSKELFQAKSKSQADAIKSSEIVAKRREIAQLKFALTKRAQKK